MLDIWLWQLFILFFVVVFCYWANERTQLDHQRQRPVVLRRQPEMAEAIIRHTHTDYVITAYTKATTHQPGRMELRPRGNVARSCPSSGASSASQEISPNHILQEEATTEANSSEFEQVGKQIKEYLANKFRGWDSEEGYSCSIE